MLMLVGMSLSFLFWAMVMAVFIRMRVMACSKEHNHRGGHAYHIGWGIHKKNLCKVMTMAPQEWLLASGK